MGLSVLAAAWALGTLLSAGLGWWAVDALSGLRPLQQARGGQLTDLRQAIPGWTGIPSWTGPSLAALLLLGGGFSVWSVLVAARCIEAIRDFALDETPKQAACVRRSVQAVRPWIVLGKLGPLLGLLLQLLILPLAGVVLRRVDPTLAPSVGVTEWLMVILSGLVSSLPEVLINWFILSAVGRWLDAVATRSSEPAFSVRRYGRQVDPWFLLTLVLLALTVMGLLGGATLPLLGFLSFFSADLVQELTTDPQLRSLGLSSGVLRGGLLTVGLGLLCSGLLNLLLALLLAWSRGFALDVATVLDAQGYSAASADPWGGPEQLVAARTPR